jgi:hypothetical protein
VNICSSWAPSTSFGFFYRVWERKKETWATGVHSGRKDWLLNYHRICVVTIDIIIGDKTMQATKSKLSCAFQTLISMACVISGLSPPCMALGPLVESWQGGCKTRLSFASGFYFFIYYSFCIVQRALGLLSTSFQVLYVAPIELVPAGFLVYRTE